ncbi:MAG: hypothetical protein GF317_01830 [Candidatus Lokiarchaeota archaeon]|nr:hypothetical protein [Candidatus Lokiarchaeota archaeon]MBD3198680.1 hypothetical protein [Candidatus Lokiarchaeota archaeon]
MLSKNKCQSDYVGPKALFNDNYVPPKLLYRKKEETSLFSILRDSLSDNFSINVLYQGIAGIGKKVIVNKVLKDLINRRNPLNSYKRITLDCREKTIEEILLSALSKILSLNSPQFDMNLIMNSKISRLWSVLKLSIKKVDKNIILILNNSEHLDPTVFKKFLAFGKESKISIISTINKVLRGSAMDLLSKFDFKRKLSYFKYKELVKILKQRANLSFKHHIDNGLIEFISDLIFENYVPIPGKGIYILRDLYPFLQTNSLENLSYDQIVEISHNHLDSMPSHDEFNILNYLAEENLFTLIFLDNLTNYFISNSLNYYISEKQLKEIYDVSCESLEYEKNVEEYKKLVNLLNNIGIMSKSRKINNALNESKSHLGIAKNIFFMGINPHKLKAMVDAIFGNFN